MARLMSTLAKGKGKDKAKGSGLKRRYEEPSDYESYHAHPDEESEEITIYPTPPAKKASKATGRQSIIHDYPVLEEQADARAVLLHIQKLVNAYLARLRQVEHERDNLRIELSAFRETPVPVQASPTDSVKSKSTKTYKLANPPSFAGFVGDIDFRSWRTAIELNLKANADFFSTPELRKAYVTSLLTGAVYDLVAPVLHGDVGNITFNEGRDVLDYLGQIFGDYARQISAEDEFDNFQIKATDELASFMAQSTRFANDAEIPRNGSSKLLHHKLTPKIQHRLKVKALKKSVTLTQYAEKAHRIALKEKVSLPGGCK